MAFFWPTRQTLILRFHISIHFVSAHATYQHALPLPVLFTEKDKEFALYLIETDAWLILLQVPTADFVRVAKRDPLVQLSPPPPIYLNYMKGLFLRKQL
jgi:hypothetical protein